MNILNNMGPRIEPCSTQFLINWKVLLTPLIFTDYFRLLKQDSNSLSAPLSNPYASNLAISKSWGRQSKAFDKSIKIGPTDLFSSEHFSTPRLVSNVHAANCI